MRLSLYDLLNYNHINFNPRTREGCDGRVDFKDLEHVSISIHAPVKGATESYRLQDARQRNFNPRTREGCDAIAIVRIGLRQAVFQSTHP